MHEYKKNNLSFMEGENNILLIAPHGHKSDDTNTGKLAREVANMLGCYAIINEHYRKPYRDKTTKKNYTTNRKTGIVDLNNTTDIKNAGMEKILLQRIFDIKKKILKSDGPNEMFIILIHGIGDDDKQTIKFTKNKPSIRVGIGKGKEDRLSADIKLIEDFVKLLGGNKEHSISARIENGGKYSGWDRRNLNQLFTGKYRGKKDDKVQSIQLEIKYTGFRDEDNLDKTAGALSSALRDIAGLNEGAEDVEKRHSTGIASMVSANKEIVAEAQPSPPVPEEQSNIALVEEAHAKLAGIFFSHYQNALLEAGQYIIDTFYDGNIELARQKKPTKALSHTQLIKRLQEQKEDAPKRSWFFNAINLVIQEHDFSTIQALGQLSTTHKLLLLSVPNPVQKQCLAEESVEKGYTSRQFAEAIRKSKKQRNKTLISYIKKPEELFSDDHCHLYSKDALGQVAPKKLKTIKKRIAEQTEELLAAIDEQQQYIEQYKTLIEAIDSVGKDNEE